jgi:hypothetical protein
MIISGIVVKHLSKNGSLIPFIQVTLCIHFPSLMFLVNMYAYVGDNEYLLSAYCQ